MSVHSNACACVGVCASVFLWRPRMGVAWVLLGDIAMSSAW